MNGKHVDGNIMAASSVTLLLAVHAAYSFAAMDSIAPRDTLMDWSPATSCEDPSASKESGTLINERVTHRIDLEKGESVYVSVKTTKSYHQQRLAVIMLTWMQTFRPQQVHIVTDDGSTDEWTSKAEEFGFAVLGANCSLGHQRQALCCKSGVEYEGYFQARESGEKYSWFCHFDDDMYVNVRALSAVLEQYDPLTEKLYLGRWSTNRKEKLEILQSYLEAFPEHSSSTYYFATGAAYCISSLLMTQLEQYLRGSAAFESVCNKLRLPDDMSVGAVIGAVLGHELTAVPTMNSHLNALRSIKEADLTNQVTISYSVWKIKSAPEGHKNMVLIPNPAFSEEEDPNRFLSYHCLLYPETPWCNDSL